MYEQLSIDPTFVFKDESVPFTISGPDTENIEDGAEVLHVNAGENYAVYIDGKKVWESGYFSMEQLMKVISDNTDGNIGAYGSRGAAFHKDDMSSLYNGPFPEDPSDIIFGHEIRYVTIQDSEDIKTALQNPPGDYVIVDVFVRDFMSEEFEETVIDVR